MIRIRDLSRDFLKFWDAAQGKEQEEQLKLWWEMYESKNPEVFGVYFSAPFWGRRENLPKALPGYGKDSEKIAKAAGKTAELIPKIVKGALTAFATGEGEIEMDVIAFVGVYGADGFVFLLEGRPAVFLALEHLAEYEIERAEALIAHELSHGLHIALGKRANPGTFAKIMENLEEFISWIARNVFDEGLGTCASKRIIPGLGERTYLFYSPEQWAWCRRNEGRLIEQLLERLDSKDQETCSKFFTTWRPTEELPYHRTGYYVGYLAIEKLLERYSLRDLAETVPGEYSGLIRKAFAKGG